MHIYLSELIPTHNVLRNPYWLIKAIKSGHSIDFDKPSILRTEDGLLYILDGHHRLCYKHYFNPDSSFEIEDSKILHYTYKEMNEINLNVGYVTPFDIKKECRHNNFMLFKKTVLALNKINYRYFDLPRFIHENRGLYVEERRVYSLKDLYVDIVEPLC